MRPYPMTVAVAATTLLFSSLCFGGDESTLGNDLQATILLHGLPCDRVVDSKRNGDSDYNAACKDGNRYHVFINSDKRVVVDRLPP